MPRLYTPYKSSSVALLGLTLLAATTFTLTGCGIDKIDNSSTSSIAPAISGYLYGGANPLVGATLKIYSTGVTPGDGTSTNSGYGKGTKLQEANTASGMSAGQDTTSTGAFQFAGGYNCPAGQFAYIVATGGSTGSNPANPNSVLVAALGRCEDLYNYSAGTYTGYKGSALYINELTTIAAAYSLGHFSAESGSGAGTIVSIGAPATNNAAQVSGTSTGCVAGVGTCTTTAAAGLAHAFQNAINLVNPFNGLAANATLAGDASAIAPQSVMDTIGNVLIACVNSTGAAANPGGACSQIFSATTIGSNVPADTFAAMVNLAANPTLSGNTANVANFFDIATAATYQPALTSSTGLNDFSLAIVYPSTLGLTYPQSAALDINDVYYVGNSASSGSTPVNVLAFSSDGTLLGTSAQNTTIKSAYNLAIDQKGFGYFGNGSGSSSNFGASFATNGGAIGGETVTTLTKAADYAAGADIYGFAVDKANNLWALASGTSNTLLKAVAGTGTPAFTAVSSPSVTAPSSHFIGLAIDPQQNVWVGASDVVAVLPNSGSLGAPAYANALVTSAPAGNPVSGFAFTGTASSYSIYASSYGQTVGTEGVESYTPTYAPAQPTISALTDNGLISPNEGANPAITGSGSTESDGAGTVWLADTNSKSIITFLSATPSAARLIPCLGNATTCSTAYGANKPYSLSIDSTGSVWATVPGSTGSSVIQIIGSAAPTWPLLALGQPAQP